MQDWILESFRHAPRIIERMIRVFPTERWDERIEKDRFTAREVVAHLADFEQVLLERFSMIKNHPGNQIAAYDPDKQCAEHKFGEKDPFREAEVYESRRQMTREYLRDFTKDDWSKTYVNAKGQLVSAGELLTLALAHDLEHVDQMSSYLATEVATIS